MKSHNLLIFVLSFLIYTTSLLAQQNIDKTDIIKNINGKDYYAHKIKKSETVYSICKNYNITEKQLATDNPEIFNGLKLGQEIIILKTNNTTKTSENITTHTVKAGETAYSISKLYNISIDEFYKNNPETHDKFQIGQIVEIKTSEIKNKKEEASENPYYIKHTVQKGETLYSLSKKYDVYQEDIINANPSLKINGLKKGEIINIPSSEFLNKSAWNEPDKTDSEIKEDKPEPVKQVENIIVEDKPLQNSNCTDTIFNKNRTIKIGILLPFELDINLLKNELSRIDVNDADKRPKTKKIFDIYQGILIAINEYKKQNYNFSLNVYDTKKDVNTVKEIVMKPEIKNLDFIIGPIYQNTFDTALKYKPANVPIINPIVDVSSNFNENYSFIQTETSDNIIFLKTVNYITSFNDANSIFISDGSENNTNIISKYTQEIQKQKPTFTVTKVNFFKDKDISNYIKKGVPNIIFITSKNEAFISNVLTKIYIATQKDSVILIGDKDWQKFNVSLNYFHSLNLTLFESRNVNYHSPEVVEFNKNYRTEYKSEPSIYSYIGADVANAYITAFTKYNSNLCNCLTNFKYSGLIYKFDLKKLNNNYINTNVFIRQYNKDLTIELK